MEKITREQFMDFFRSDDFHNQVTPDDTEEIWLSVLHSLPVERAKSLFEEICSDYNVTLDEVFAKYHQPYELIGELAEVVQNLIDYKGLDFPNEDKPKDESASTIYGSDYDYLLDEFRHVLESRSILINDRWGIQPDELMKESNDD
jgi:hypothetical protein